MSSVVFPGFSNGVFHEKRQELFPLLCEAKVRNAFPSVNIRFQSETCKRSLAFRVSGGLAREPPAIRRRRSIKVGSCQDADSNDSKFTWPDEEELNRRRQITESALQEQLSIAAEQVLSAEAKVRVGAAAIEAAAVAAKVARQENKDAGAIEDLERAADMAARTTAKVATVVQAAKARIEASLNVSLSPDADTISQELQRHKDCHSASDS